MSETGKTAATGEAAGDVEPGDVAPVGTAAGDPYERDLDDPEIYPLVPTVDTTRREFQDRFVHYAGVGPNDAVLSGPVIGGWGPGRYHQSRRQAREWLEARFGRERVRETEGISRGRWSFVIRDLKIRPYRPEGA